MWGMVNFLFSRSVVDRLTKIRRAVSPVVGVALLIVLVIALAAVVTTMALSFGGDLEEPEFEQNPWADDDALLAPEDPTPGAEDVRYRVLFEIQDDDVPDDGELSDVEVFVDVEDDMFNDTELESLETFNAETIDGDTIDLTASDNVDDWELDDDETVIEMELGGDVGYDPQIGDLLVIIFGDVNNPDTPGTYDIEVDLNGDGETQFGELEITEGLSLLARRSAPVRF